MPCVKEVGTAPAHIESKMSVGALEICQNRWKSQKKGYTLKHLTL